MVFSFDEWKTPKAGRPCKKMRGPKPKVAVPYQDAAAAGSQPHPPSEGPTPPAAEKIKQKRDAYADGENRAHPHLSVLVHVPDCIIVLLQVRLEKALSNLKTRYMTREQARTSVTPPIPKATFNNYASGKAQLGDKPGKPTLLTDKETKFLIDVIRRYDRANMGLTTNEIYDIIQELRPELNRTQCARAFRTVLHAHAEVLSHVKAQATTHNLHSLGICCSVITACVAKALVVRAGTWAACPCRSEPRHQASGTVRSMLASTGVSLRLLVYKLAGHIAIPRRHLQHGRTWHILRAPACAEGPILRWWPYGRHAFSRGGFRADFDWSRRARPGAPIPTPARRILGERQPPKKKVHSPKI